jgi:hypothetical protein
MKKFTKIAAAVSLALAAGSASASVTGPQAGDSLGSILLSLEDNNAASANYKHTFIFDLALDGHTGLNYASFINGTQGANGTLSWNLNSIAEFAGFKNDTADLNWSVVGGSQRSNIAGSANNINPVGVGYAAIAPWGALVTGQAATDFAAAGYSKISGQLASTGLVGGWYDNANIFIGANANSVDVAAADSPATTSQYESLFPNIGTLHGTTSGFLNTLGAGTDNFYAITNSIGTAAGNANTITKLGSFTLDGATNNLTFQSASVAAVPLPGAVWLFASALIGGLGIAKRKRSL